MSWPGCSATSGSRLFMSIRMAASCGHPLHVSVAPRGARTTRSVTRSSSLSSIPLATPPCRHRGHPHPRGIRAVGLSPGARGLSPGGIGGSAPWSGMYTAFSVVVMIVMIVTALVAAVLYGVGAAVEQRQAAAAPDDSAGKPRLPVHPAPNPLSLLGPAHPFA